MRLLQIRNGTGSRRVGVIIGDRVVLLNGVESIYELAWTCLSDNTPMDEHAGKLVGHESLSYDEVYCSQSDWRILPAVDHPQEPARCLVSGTGLTHMKSAENRQAMHACGGAPTDSMKMYEWGLAGGRPAPGSIGISPEWFYKGCGTVLRGHGDALPLPPHAEDGGEESEIAGIYIIDSEALPHRIGMAIGNEFSDHVVEKKNYLYLASSKLMYCAIGPELVTNPRFDFVSGEVSIERNKQVLWRRQIRTGEEAMCHSLANIEHHHFKHPAHRRPGDVHVHFFGADAFSAGEGIKLEQDDVVQILFEGFGRPLRNSIAIDRTRQNAFAAAPL